MIYILYNPKANRGKANVNDAVTELRSQNDEIRTLNIIDIELSEFLESLSQSDKLVIFGGDGTLSLFADATYDFDFPCKVFLYKAGTGNDFFLDVEPNKNVKLLEINRYLKNLPIVEVNGIRRHYINGIGYGIDGRVCEVADDRKANGKFHISYMLIALGLFFVGYGYPDATVTVDGVERRYKRVWIAPAMHGRFYGGGMMAAPNQRRNSGKLSAVVVHSLPRLRALFVFPGIYRGKHIRETDIVEVIEGNDIHVRFSKPTALQIDGETVKDVHEYRAVLAIRRQHE